MAIFRFHCPSCQKFIKHDSKDAYKYCPFCGTRFTKSKNGTVRPVDNRYIVVPAEEFRALLEPLLALNGIQWLAKKIGVDWVRVSDVLNKQQHVTFDLADRWLQKLGLTQALSDGTLTVIDNTPKGSQPPPSQYWED